MPYNQFTTIAKARTALDLSIEERVFFPSDIQPVSPSEMLRTFLKGSLPSAATGSEKARSEGIIYPMLAEVRQILDFQISVFSGEDFSIDESKSLNGIVDFLISRSPIVSTIEAPVTIIVEAKKGDISRGVGQCIAEMVAAQQFNQEQGNSIKVIYGCVTTGTQWRFLKLEGKTVTLDLTDYPLPPIEKILGFLVWMASAPQ